MSLVSGFANQSASLQKYTGKDGFNKPTYAPSRMIKCRKEPAQGVRFSATGTDLNVETYFLTEAVVTTQDKLDGKVVRRLKEVIGKGGQRLGVEVWV